MAFHKSIIARLNKKSPPIKIGINKTPLLIRCFMLCMFAKNEQGDLTQKQLKELAHVVREEFK